MMTGADWSNSRGRVMRWLAARRGDLIADLAGALDLEAGLHDASIPARHRAVADDLAAVLDLDAGLTAIVGGSRAPSSRPSAARRSLVNTRDLIDVVAAAPPAVSLALRQPMRFYLRILDDLYDMGVVRAYTRRLVRYLPDLHHDGTTARRARNTAETLREYIKHVRFSQFDRPDRADLTAADELAGVVAALDPASGDDVARAQQLGQALQQSNDPDGEVERAWIRTVDLAHTTSEQLGIGAALGCSLDISHVDLGDPNRLHQMVDDFTDADLRDVDIAGLLDSGGNLDGMRWSDRTLWPDDTWLEWALQNSERLGPGVYQIQPGAGASTLLPQG
jgi:hypothetical protein